MRRPPGGKSTQIAGLLAGEGLLWSNEIVKSRAQALLSNVERLGVPNAVVSSCHPQRLCQSLQGFFDKVLVDAPCSGEGMFRRDPAAVAQWSPESPAACAQRQRAILDSAALAVREGGVLVYSTCTFSQEENEDNVRWFLSAHPEFALLPIEAGFGRPGVGDLPVRRIYPMDGGEGHFVAKFQRVGENVDKPGAFTAYLSRREEGEFQGLFEELFTCPWPGSAARFGDRVVLLPQGLPELSGLGVLRAGGGAVPPKRQALGALPRRVPSRPQRRLPPDFGPALGRPGAFGLPAGGGNPLRGQGLHRCLCRRRAHRLRQGLRRPAEKPLSQRAAVTFLKESNQRTFISRGAAQAAA